MSVTPEIRAWSWLPFDTPPEAALFPGLVALLLAVVAVWPSPALRSLRGRIPLYLMIAAAAVLLSFGPQPPFWPDRWTSPYRWLVTIVPGFSALRVPARIVTLFLLALAVLAGFGAARLLQRVRPSARVLGAIGLAAAVILESYGGPPNIEPFRHKRERDEQAVYARLRNGPPGGAIELPMQGGLMVPSRSDLLYQFNTLFHGRPIVNGSSRYEPPLARFLKGSLSPLREPAQLPDLPRMFRAIGVRYVVVRPGDFRFPDLAEATLQALAASLDTAGREAFVTDESPIHLFELAPPLPGPMGSVEPWRELPGTAYSASASHNSAQFFDALDGDTHTKWLSGAAQTGDEVIDIHLYDFRDIARVRLEIGGSYGHYPRELVVAHIEADGTTRDLFTGSLLPHLARGILADPDRVPIDVELPPNRTRHLRVRQTGANDRLGWAIHNLSVWER